MKKRIIDLLDYATLICIVVGVLFPILWYVLLTGFFLNFVNTELKK